MTRATDGVRQVVLERCRVRIPFGGAYTSCGGAHPTDLHNAADMASYVRGLEFAAEMVHAEARWQTERQMSGHADAGPIADRMTEVEKALRAVMRTIEPGDRQEQEEGQ